MKVKVQMLSFIIILSGVSVKIFIDQLKMSSRKKKGRRFSQATRRLALSIRFRNYRTYNFLGKVFALPSPDMLRKYVGDYNKGVGWSEVAFTELKKKLQHLDEKDKVCIIALDAMSISPGISYNYKKDKFDGFEDLGEYASGQSLATQAVVFMVQGVSLKFKQAVGYFMFSSHMTSDDVKPMLIDCITRMKIAGAIPKVVVCDQGGPHQRLFKLFGTTITKPYFEHVYNDVSTRLYTMWDTPHLLKSIRNNLMNYDFNIGGEIMSWRYIKYIYEQQEGDPKDLRILPKLTSKHIRPNSLEKMRVFLAAQALSNTVAAALETLAETIEDDQERTLVLTTAKNVRKVDRIFDIFNSSVLPSTKPEKLPTKPENNVTNHAR